MANNLPKCEHILLFVLFLSYISPSTGARSKFIDRFCAISCNKGRGGVLCGCNVSHFAGKRTISLNYNNNNEKQADDLLNELSNKDESINTLNIDNLLQYPFEQTAQNKQNQREALETSLPVQRQPLKKIPDDQEKLENTRLFVQMLLNRLENAR